MDIKNIIFIILVIAFSNNQIKACQCFELSVEKEVKNSDWILTGKVLSKEVITLFDSSYIKLWIEMDFDTTDYQRHLWEFDVVKYTFQVEEVYKGIITKKEIEIYTGFGNGDCGFPFQINKRYLIYGNLQSYFENNPDEDIDYPKGENIIWTYCFKRTKKIDKKEISQIEKVLKKKK